MSIFIIITTIILHFAKSLGAGSLELLLCVPRTAHQACQSHRWDRRGKEQHQVLTVRRKAATAV